MNVKSVVTVSLQEGDRQQHHIHFLGHSFVLCVCIFPLIFLLLCHE